VTKRENLLAVLRRRGGEFIPFGLSFTPRMRREFKERYRPRLGREPMLGDVCETCHEAVALGPSRAEHDYARYYENRTLKPGTALTADGVAREPAGFEHFTHVVSPLAGREPSLEEIEIYPLDDRDAAYRHEAFAADAARAHERGMAVALFAGNVFERAWQIRGMEDLLMDFYEAPELAHALLERITRINCALAAAAARAGADVVRFGDDVGTQQGMMIAPEVWRTFLKERLARQFAAVKQANPEALVWYHSDGDVTAIVPELIEIGLDILNPVQPECMDIDELKRRYGDRLSFWGGVGTQTTLPFGTPDEVRAAVKHLVEVVGRGGGLYIEPTHVIEPDVPWQNIEAYLDACRTYGRAACL